MIRALAIRTASVLGDCFFGVVVSASAVGIMLNCVGAVEPCWMGCTLIGPADVGLLLGIIDNAHLSRSFRRLFEKNRHFLIPGRAAIAKLAAGESSCNAD
jgi:hypothetical protein